MIIRENTEKTNFLDSFGEYVFSDVVMKRMLPESVFLELLDVRNNGRELSRVLADQIAEQMKNWAVANGATHYTHWFQPLTGNTAEKHDSFLDTDGQGNIILKFSGKNLIKGEADASSFPSGGTRATFEARGYTVWDCTSPAFIKKSPCGMNVLCIPTAFCSYNGMALDKKTPLLRSMQSINRQALRVLRLLGNTTTKKVGTELGAEQEYFLIDKQQYLERKDLIFTGRTLFGNIPPKGQEKNDQYYASIKERVLSFMNELNHELWKLGVIAKTQHNEAAPSQHELAPIFDTANIATDHNQLIMEKMKRVASTHNLSCLLHEKPFKGVNGSGKHCNWSISTDDGGNLLKPGKNPLENIPFLVFFTCIISAVDEYSELLRMSAAHPGNDHRLGGNEAPPAILSVYVGEMLDDILNQIETFEARPNKTKEKMQTGVSSMPIFSKDFEDRNRTSPFAFTGNKFEFRMVGSSATTATPCLVLCTAVAEMLCQFADAVETAKSSETAIMDTLRDMLKKHRRIIFNGNNYSKEWYEEAKRRGLPNIDNCVDAFNCLTDEKSVKLFEKHNVMNYAELAARQDIYYQNYEQTLHIEVTTMLSIAKTEILPKVNDYIAHLAKGMKNLLSVGANIDTQKALLDEINCKFGKFYSLIGALEQALFSIEKMEGHKLRAEGYRDLAKPAMENLREVADSIEPILPKEFQPFPSYADLLFYEG